MKRLKSMKKKTIEEYYLKYFWLFAIGIIADIVVDVCQTYVPEFLGAIVEAVSSSASVTVADVSDILYKIVTIAFTLMVGRAVLRFTMSVLWS